MENAEKGSACLEERVKRIERQNRRLRQLTGVTLIVLAALVLMGQVSPKGRTVEAQTIVLKEPDGKVRARLETKGPEVLLSLFDRKEKTRIELVVADRAAFLTLSDATGRPREMFGVTGDHAPEEASLGLTDKNGNSAVLLTVGQDVSGIKIFDAQHNLASGLVVTPLANSLLFSDSAGKPRAQLGVSMEQPALLLYDQSGKLTWHAP